MGDGESAWRWRAAPIQRMVTMMEMGRFFTVCKVYGRLLRNEDHVHAVHLRFLEPRHGCWWLCRKFCRLLRSACGCPVVGDKAFPCLGQIASFRNDPRGADQTVPQRRSRRFAWRYKKRWREGLVAPVF